MSGETLRLGDVLHPEETVNPVHYVMPYGTLEPLVTIEGFEGSLAMRKPEDVGFDITDID